jgi:hypothetical protein
LTAKRLPTDKTVVTELKIQLADQFTRNRIISESIAARVSQDVGFKQGDATITLMQPLILTDIRAMVYIHSWGSFLLRVAYKDTAVQEVPCSGLFLMYGELDSVEIHSATDEQLRVAYVYS